MTVPSSPLSLFSPVLSGSLGLSLLALCPESWGFIYPVLPLSANVPAVGANRQRTEEKQPRQLHPPVTKIPSSERQVPLPQSFRDLCPLLLGAMTSTYLSGLKERDSPAADGGRDSDFTDVYFLVSSYVETRPYDNTKGEKNGKLTTSLVCFKFWAFLICLPLFTFQKLQIDAPFILSRFCNSCIRGRHGVSHDYTISSGTGTSQTYILHIYISGLVRFYCKGPDSKYFML